VRLDDRFAILVELNEVARVGEADLGQLFDDAPCGCAKEKPAGSILRFL
jgi:hypothetical protein